ncbi:MAG: SprB repeat-containing protein, partial [Bacteroidetes bacterium]|nr:SprB repeat-containing protein [Bacteroidota bacterium]
MRKFTIFSMLMIFAFAVSAQAPGGAPAKPLAVPKMQKQAGINPGNSPVTYYKGMDFKSVKDFGDIFYEEHFSNQLPAGWTTADLQGNNCIWEWTDIGAQGPTTAGYTHVLASTTAADGWMILDSDNYGSLAYDAILTSPAYDFSAIPTPQLVFEELYKRWGQEACSPVGGNPTFVEVSTNGTDWTQIEIHANFGTKDETNNPGIMKVNLTNYVANEPVVYIRFRMQGCWDYWWQIDDMAIVEAPENDLVISTGFQSYYYLFGELFYYNTMTPKDHAWWYRWAADVANMGINDQTNVNLHVTVDNGVSVDYDWAEDSLGTWVSETNDTMMMDSVFLPYLVKADYTVTYEVSADETEQVPEDNTDQLLFSITDTTWAHDLVRSGSIGPWSYTDAADGDLIGTGFYIPMDDTLGSVSVYISTYTTPLTTVIKGEVWYYDSGLQDYILQIDSDEHVIQPDDLGTWITLPLTSDDGLQEYALGDRDYNVMINCTWGTDTLLFGSDGTESKKHCYNTESALRLGGTWYYISYIPMVRLNMHRTNTCDPFIANANATDISCFGETDGSINISTIGGGASFTYSWSTGDTVQNVTDLAAGTYTVTVATCGAQDTVISVDVAEPAALSTADVVVDNTHACNANGSVDVTISGGTSPYEILWTDGSTDEQITGLAPGLYEYTVTDNNGCTAIYSATVAGIDELEVTYNTTNITCHGDADGAITMIISGGTTQTILWSTGATTETLTGLDGGAYIYTVTDNSGCNEPGMVVITEPDELVLNGTFTDISCNGLSDGTIDAVAEGGTAPYTILWSPTNDTAFLITDLAAGDYIAFLQDANGCPEYDTITITEPDALATTETVTDNTSACTANGSAVLVIAGGTTPYDNVIWSNGATGNSLANLNSGDYWYTVTDANDCEFIDSVSLAGPDALTHSALVTNISCNGQTDGAIDLTVSGGTEPYSFAWSNSETTEDLENLSAGEYYLTFSDDGGCTTYDTLVITEPTALVADAVGTDLACNGDNDGTIDLTVTGGIAYYTYEWSNDSITEDLSGLAGGTYEVTVTDNNGCTVTVTNI